MQFTISFDCQAEPSTEKSDQVDLFGQNLIGDLLDVPTSVLADNSTVTSHPSEVDLFADANFALAKPQSEVRVASQAPVCNTPSCFFCNFTFWFVS